MNINEQLHKACAESNYEQVKKLLEKGADPNCYIKNYTALYVAIMKSSKSTCYKIIKALLEHGADPNAEYKFVLGSPFVYYCWRDYDVLKLALKYGVNLETKHRHYTSVFSTFRYYNYKCCKLMIKKINDPLKARNYIMETLFDLKRLSEPSILRPEIHQQYIDNAICAIRDILKKYKQLYRVLCCDYVDNDRNIVLDMKMLISKYLFKINNVGFYGVDKNDKDYVVY